MCCCWITLCRHHQCPWKSLAVPSAKIWQQERKQHIFFSPLNFWLRVILFFFSYIEVILAPSEPLAFIALHPEKLSSSVPSAMNECLLEGPKHPWLGGIVSAELGISHSFSSWAAMNNEQLGLLWSSPFWRRPLSSCFGCSTIWSLECVCHWPQRAWPPETLLCRVVCAQEKMSITA